MLLGEILTELGHASPDEIAEALALQRQEGRRVGAILVALGIITEEQLASMLRVQQEVEAAEALEDAAA